MKFEDRFCLIGCLETMKRQLKLTDIKEQKSNKKRRGWNLINKERKRRCMK